MKSIVLFIFGGALCLGQSVTASVQGQVSDPSGARIAAAKVSITNTNTRASRQTLTDDAGLYVIPSLAVGSYELRVERDGFKTSSTKSFELTVNQNSRLDIQLELGSVNDRIVVESTPELLETQNATVSGLVDKRRVVELPLNGRNFSQLVNLQPGVAVVSGQGLNGGGSDSGGIQGSGAFVNGARGSNNNFLFDGGDANDPVVPTGTGASSTSAFTGGAGGINAISVDAIQEFRVITSGASAEFGRSSGAVINVITKSGTNQLHGSAFHYLRNRALNARNTYETAKPPFVQNNFGGTLGGPLRKDKTFIFGSYEGFRQRQSVNVPNVIPSPNTIEAVRQQNPLLGSLLAGYFAAPQLAGAQFAERTPAQIIASQQPVLATVQLPRGNGLDQNALLFKVDQSTWKNGRFSGRYQIFDGDGLPGTVAGSGLPGSNVGYSNRSQNLVLSHTQPIGSRSLNDFRAVFQRNSPRTTFEATSQAALDAGRLRSVGPFAGQPYGDPETPNGIPTIGLGFGIVQVGYDTTAPNRRAVNTFQVSDTFTQTWGAHTLKYGFEVRRIQENSVFSFRLRPEVSFVNVGANTILSPGAPVQSLDQNVFISPSTSLRGYRLTEWAGFVQDNYRVNSRLTLDFGLRYEYFGRPNEVNGILNNGFLAPNGNVQAEADILSNGPQGLKDFRLITVGPGRQYSLFRADRNNFAPRFGLAYRPGFGLVLRASYGIYYDRLFNNVFGNARNSPPYTVGAQISGQPFGAVPAVDPFTTNLQVAPVTINPNIRSPYTQRFNFSVQREILKDTIVDFAYVGSRALNLVRTLRPNQGASFAGDFRPANIDNAPFNRTVDDFRPNVLGNISTRDGSGHSTYHSFQASLQRRFSKGLSVQVSYTLGSSKDLASGEIVNDVVVTTISNTTPVRTANGLVATPSLATVNQARALRNEAPFTNVADAARFFNANYTGPNQWRADIGNSLFDVRHIFVSNASYELPWAKTKWYGGWQVNAIFRAQTGIPFSILSGADVNGDGNATDRAALLSGSLDSIVSGAGGRQFFLPSTLTSGAAVPSSRSFTDGAVVGVSRTPENVFSYLERGALHGRALRLLDFSTMKYFRVKENVRVQFRAEFFNLPNTTNYGLPVNNITSPLFGQILATSTPPRQIQFALRLEF